MAIRSQVVDRLIALLDQGDEVDRCNAAQALGRLGDSRAKDALYNHLQDEDLDVCVDAAQALGVLGDEEATRGLVEALAYHCAGDVKLAAAKALNERGGSIAMEALRPLVLERPEDMDTGESEGWDDWWDLQLEAVKAMGNHGHQAAMDEIDALLDDEDCQDIESEALKALALMGAPGTERLKQRLQDATPRSQRRIATALGHSHNDEALSVLTDLLASPRAEVREASCRALSKRQDSDGAARLVHLLGDPNADVQVAALEGLERLSAGVLNTAVCVELAEVDSQPVRQMALRLLHLRCKNSPAPSSELAALALRATQAENAEEASIACQLLACVGSAEDVPAVLERVNDAECSPLVRCEAIKALEALKDSSQATLEALLGCCDAEQLPVRHGAMKALLALNSVATAEALEIPPLEMLHRMLAGESPLPEPTAEVTEQEAVAENASVSLDEAVVAIKPEAATEPEGDLQLIDTLTLEDKVEKAPTMEEILAGMSSSYPESTDDDFTSAAGSTLDAITRSNAEAAVASPQNLSSDSERILQMVDDLPEEYAEFGNVVHHNARTGERMLSDKKRRKESTAESRAVLAALILSEASDELSVQKLLLCLMDENAELRKQAVESLAAIAENHPQLESLKNCLGALVTQLHAGTEEIRLGAARALGVLGHKSAIKPLFAALDDQDTLVRIQAIRSLVAIERGGKKLDDNDHVSLDEVAPTRIIQAIRACHKDPEIGVRVVVIEALGALKYADVELLVNMGLEPGGALSDVAAKVLRPMNSEAATARLIDAIDTPDSMVRRLAVSMLTSIHGAQAV
ncbi:HEAT repeat domain-containing protein [Aestuariirhabdus sp. Z084]|uniref:HEAT repeat domain-containing protein n=1 Tax=Aestuariirhabdus haliotis TaxID=2918751 RepID=UPI00201B39D6|nr:HEAT repeat domain-containing protein [Aestuariirhabdus haliotis]MCL6416552.1 HEAT repeat domain-containing protein [Aestuariirhabdus haliotis]MCL6420581.1 HEAT repeat domain-containing protein [Aestuariirhabdus haliotis]